MSTSNQKVIPFQVSARTARLIGRENIATSKGAIIELVKNGYDADSRVSIVYFDNKSCCFQNEIEESFFQDLIAKGISTQLLHNAYEKQDSSYVLKKNITEEDKLMLKSAMSKLSSIYIIDFGEGMTQKIIREHWMTIGTDNKANNIFTKSRRVKAGAKGIGRFALDKLGSKCEMTTIFNPDYHTDTDEFGHATSFTGYNWIVNWEDFEGEFKTIDKVGAILTGINTEYLREELSRRIPTFDFSKIEPEKDFKYGTILKISELRDNWEDYFVGQVYSDLEILVPPKESEEFSIFVFSSLFPNKYGEVSDSICDDFDYKLTAVADENQNVKIRVYRNEYDLESMPPDFFDREGLQKEPYTKPDFSKGYWEREYPFSQLVKGFKEVDQDNTFHNIGVFNFTFYYLKRQSNSLDAKKFFNRNFMANARKDWLNKFGGIKLFRDNFRVRPYGEVKDTAFDWLGLGNRKSASPAGIGKKEGGYKVEPENVAGSIRISRLTNVNFEDKSSREGLQENKTFDIFKRLIAGIIEIFEEDRAYIAREMAEYDDLKYGPERDRQKAEELAKKILEESRRKKEEKSKTDNDNSQQRESNGIDFDTDKEILASEIERKEEEIGKLKEEQKILRGLASSGIVLASFSHDLGKLSNILTSRTDALRQLLAEKLSEADYAGIPDRKNPFKKIEDIKEDDLKVQNWLKFSLGATRKDKRNRKQVFLKPYFDNFQSDWNIHLEERGITMDVSNVEQLVMRIFEIDLDSIFNNLLVNSIDAFNISKENRARTVTIKAHCVKEITIEYYDNGPGLLQDIINKEEIFSPLFTTKRNQHTGEAEGTGLGMWIVKSIVEENDGKVQLLYPEVGFGLRMAFPVKFKRK